MTSFWVALAGLGALLTFSPLRADPASSSATAPPLFTGDYCDERPESILTRNKLTSIIIPEVDFENADIYSVIDFLTLKSKELDPAKTGIQFRLELPPGSVSKLSGPQWDVLVNMKGASLITVLYEVCDDDPPLEWFISKGVVVLYSEGKIVPADNNPAEPPSEIKARKDVARSLRRIILPTVDFKNEDIAVVVKFLSEQSQRFDPKHFGVKMELRLPADNPPGKFHVRRSVSITLDNVSIEDVLGYVIAQANLGYTIEPNGIVIKAGPEY